MTFIELLLASKGGSKSAFEELFGRYKNLLRKYSVINGIFDDDLYQEQCMVWCCTIKVDIENSKGQYIEKDKQEATKDGSESTKIQHGI